MQQAEHLRDLRDRQNDTAQRTETDPQNEGPDSSVSMTFRLMIWISQHGKKYITSSLCTALDIAKG